ncbi:hypothetical protein F5884DRAFT_803827 [Xylogone sp. PMI_703]|nr:hypothetical protein F5884DRAFT_803827 [Xylogone sp. PMI_703]
MDMNELLILAEDFSTSDFLKPQDREFFESSSYEDVLQDLNTIQSQRHTTKTMMNMKRISSFLTGMAHLEKVLTVIKFQHTARVMSYVWGPVRYLLKTTNLTEKAFDSVLDVYEQLGNNIPPFYEYIRLFIRLPESERCLVYAYQDIITFHRLACRLFSLRSSVWLKLHKPTWKALSHTFKHLEESLGRHKRFIEVHGLCLRNPQANLNQGNQDVPIEPESNLTQDWHGMLMEFYRYRNDLSGFKEDFEEEQRIRIQNEKKDVITWISASKKTQSIHTKLQDMRICPDTGRWLFRRYSEVRDWMKEDQPPESTIWLHGSRGFGKTVLASLIVDELKELCTEKKKYEIPQNSKTYYFYCQEDDPEHRTFLGILKGILHQMVDAGEDLLPLCAETAKSSGSTNLENVKVAQNLIETFFEYNPRQYIIIDGVDECETHEEIREAAMFFTGKVTECDNKIKQGQLRVLFISQPMPELVRRKIMLEEDAYVELKPTDNANDIRAFVKKRIPEFSERQATGGGFNLSEDDERQIEGIICRRSEDMFLYAHLAVEYLLQQPTKEKLLERIKEEMLPKELSQIYEKLLGAVKAELLQLAEGEDHWQTAKLLLGWLVCAKRPLKWHEMQSILSYDPSRQWIDFDKKMLRQNVTKYLGSLVHILDGSHIRIIHSTARRYIIQNKYINEQAVQCDLTILCLRYLCLLSFSNRYDEDERREKAQLGWFSFQDYACSQWYSHIFTMVSACKDLFLDSNRGQVYINSFDSALQDFIDKYDPGLTEIRHADLQHTPPELTGFSGLSFYGNLDRIWNHIYTHQKGTYADRNKVGIAQLDLALQNNRMVLEENFKPSSPAYLNDTIEDYYGPNLFKCKRVLCKFFYLGYDKKKDRELHDSRHERPYPCPMNCNLAPIGFSTKKDRERHVRNYHPDLSEGPSIFEALRPSVENSRFICSMCSKKFTRKITLKGHERSHFGERPYECSTCSKAFTRINDCRRHEKIHSKGRA